MATFEGYERRIAQIEKCMKEYGFSSLDEVKQYTIDKGLDVDGIVRGIQPIAFENAVWAYTLGAAIALKKGCAKASEAACAIGIGPVSYTHLSERFARQVYSFSSISFKDNFMEDLLSLFDHRAAVRQISFAQRRKFIRDFFAVQKHAALRNEPASFAARFCEPHFHHNVEKLRALCKFRRAYLCRGNAAARAAASKKRFRRGLRSVSYTHLDVYKRQYFLQYLDVYPQLRSSKQKLDSIMIF